MRISRRFWVSSVVGKTSRKGVVWTRKGREIKDKRNLLR